MDIMIKVTLLAMGKLKESYLRSAAAEYEKRLSGLCKFQCIELDPVRLPDHPSEAEIQTALETEGKRILAKIPAGAAVFPLCIEGKGCTSQELAAMVDRAALSGQGHLIFIIGSSYGLSDRVKQAGTRQLSMSRMTFPHQLARIMLLEQIYRAFKINEGSAYHK